MSLLIRSIVYLVFALCSIQAHADSLRISSGKIEKIEVVYFKKFNNFLRPFEYTEKTPQVIALNKWLKNNRSGWKLIEKLPSNKEIVTIIEIKKQVKAPTTYELIVYDDSVIIKYSNKMLVKKIISAELAFINP